jgi:hypothetical protein
MAAILAAEVRRSRVVALERYRMRMFRDGAAASARRHDGGARPEPCSRGLRVLGRRTDSRGDRDMPETHR